MGSDTAIYVVKLNGKYLAWNGWQKSRSLSARLCRRDADATAKAYPGSRVVRLRVRPPSERLWLAARLAAWEPTIALVLRWAGVGGGVVADYAVQAAALAIPEEHRP